ncbi:SH3 domain-containing protein [Cellulophaga sp. Z1A5H]|uniref:SH3 domain-containing protein n=1 Tax=Cellulophaga sp. Z1A5H TaxID=2687291 RepID=UPI0013FD1810|nr:SH3 domain-containing protein [Cellulophaga sp. Z1A5H]
MELDDYYGSVFFIYGFSNDCFFRLGDFVIPQPNVELEGVKQEFFKISELNDIITIERFLDKKQLPKLEFSSNKKCIKSNQKIVYAQVDTYLNIRSAANKTATIVGKAYPKDGLKVLEVLEGWLKVSLNGTEGYISSEFVK